MLVAKYTYISYNVLFVTLLMLLQICMYVLIFSLEQALVYTAYNIFFFSAVWVVLAYVVQHFVCVVDLNMHTSSLFFAFVLTYVGWIGLISNRNNDTMRVSLVLDKLYRYIIINISTLYSLIQHTMLNLLMLCATIVQRLR
jgi:hypothetical protein